MARTLLRRGRPDDVVRMIEPLVGNAASDGSDATLHALLARVHLLVHADLNRARTHLEMAFSKPHASSQAEAERRLWRGWLHTWPHKESFQPALALADFQGAHHLAEAEHDLSTAAWASLGAAFLYLWLDEIALAGHLLDEAVATGSDRHDVDFLAWHAGCAAILAVKAGDAAAANDRLRQAQSAIDGANIPLYQGRVLALAARIAVLEDAGIERVTQIMEKAQPIIRDGARTYSPAQAELEICRIDALLRRGDFPEASSRLDAFPDEARTIVRVDERLLERRSAVADKRTPTTPPPVDLPARPSRWPDGSTFDLPFWRSLPSLAETALPIFLAGERGTGKRYLAEQIHQQAACEGPFVLFDCAAPVSGDVDVMLFGRGGNGLVDEAANGMLFLREIERLPLDTQRRLARLLRSGSPRFRLAASTNSSVDSLIKDAGLSRDLLSEIGRLVVHIPPLRERRSHISLLVSDLIEKLRPRDLTLASITHEALRAIIQYDWPGNIRQLQNELERMLTVVGSEPAPVIHIHDLPDDILKTFEPAVPGDGGPTDSLDEVIARAEQEHIVRVLARNGGQVSATAEELGLSRQGLYKKMKRLGIDSSRLNHDPSVTVSG